MKVQAQLAMHRLVTGSMVEELQGPNNTRTRFMATDTEKLAAYIVWIDSQIAAVATGQSQRHRPVYFTPDM